MIKFNFCHVKAKSGELSIWQAMWQHWNTEHITWLCLTHSSNPKMHSNGHELVHQVTKGSVILAEKYKQFVTLYKPHTWIRQRSPKISSSLSHSPSFLLSSYVSRSLLYSPNRRDLCWLEENRRFSFAFAFQSGAPLPWPTCDLPMLKWKPFIFKSHGHRAEGGKKHSREEITDMNHHNALRRLPMNGIWDDGHRRPLLSRRRLWCL